MDINKQNNLKKPNIIDELYAYLQFTKNLRKKNGF